MKTITPDIDLKLEMFSKVLFDNNKHLGPRQFNSWQEQHEEVRKHYEQGKLTDFFLDFATRNGGDYGKK